MKFSHTGRDIHELIYLGEVPISVQKDCSVLIIICGTRLLGGWNVVKSAH